jgi:hypothetical protein
MEGLKSNANGTEHEFTASGGIYVLVAVVILTAIASVLGNLLVQVAFWKTTCLRASSPATLVMVLALVDFLMAILVMPFVVTTALHGRWYQSHGLCVASGFLNTILTAIQFGVLFSISLNRFSAVSFPHRYQLKWKTKTTYVMISVVFLHSLLWSIMPFLGWGGYDYIEGTLFCNINWSEHKSHSTSLFAFCYIIPALVAALLYMTVYVKIRKMGQSPIAQLRMGSQLDLRIGQIGRDDNSFYSDVHSKINSNDPSSSPGKKGRVWFYHGYF